MWDTVKFKYEGVFKAMAWKFLDVNIVACFCMLCYQSLAHSPTFNAHAFNVIEKDPFISNLKRAHSQISLEHTSGTCKRAPKRWR